LDFSGFDKIYQFQMGKKIMAKNRAISRHTTSFAGLFCLFVAFCVAALNPGFRFFDEKR